LTNRITAVFYIMDCHVASCSTLDWKGYDQMEGYKIYKLAVLTCIKQCTVFLLESLKGRDHLTD
jgi:hypothetical protein